MLQYVVAHDDVDRGIRSGMVFVSQAEIDVAHAERRGVVA